MLLLFTVNLPFISITVPVIVNFKPLPLTPKTLH
jgi:hypothetical protein